MQHKVPTKGGLFASDRFIFKMAQDRINLPSSGGGIVRYFEEFKSNISLKPQLVIVLVVIVVILEIILHMYGNSLFGLA